MTTDKKLVGLKLPQELWIQAQKRAIELGVSKSQFVQEAIEKKMEEVVE